MRRFVSGCALAVGLMVAGPAVHRASAGVPPPDAAAVVARAMPIAVAIKGESRIAVKPAAGTSAATPVYENWSADGSGFIIDPSGIVMTNHHVIEGASEIFVTLHDHTRLRARLLYTSPIDMVLLKVDAGRKLPAAVWGDSNKLQPGDPVLAIGNPLGIGISVSEGIISALERNIGETQAAVGGKENYDNFLQTDAALNHGNSGGPLFDLQGKVIGMSTSLISPTSGSAGLGFAIPARDLLFILDQYHKYGRVRPGWLGANVQAMTFDLAAAVKLPQPLRGAMIDSVAPGGPAAKAGLQSGDVVLRVRDVEIADVRDYDRAVGATPFDSTAPVAFWRGGSEHVVSVKFAESPNSQKPQPPAAASTASEAPPEAGSLGLTITALTPDLRHRLGIEGDQPGVVITNVVPDSVAYHHGFQAGDVVVQVEGRKIETEHDIRTAVGAARKAGDKEVLALLRQGQQYRWIAMPMPAPAH